MVARRYQDLVCWQLCRELERRVYAFTAIKPAAADVDFCRQIRKSSSSASRNICEGFGRFLPGDFGKFTRNALGSLNETLDHLDKALEERYLSPALYQEMIQLAGRAIGATTNLSKYLDSARHTWRRRRKTPPRAKNKEPEP